PGSARSSSRSSSRRHEARRPGARGWPRDGGGHVAWCLRRRKKLNMVVLLYRTGLRYNDKVITPGAQTERRGEAWPVRVMLGGGHAPATFLLADSTSYHQNSVRR